MLADPAADDLREFGFFIVATLRESFGTTREVRAVFADLFTGQVWQSTGDLAQT